MSETKLSALTLGKRIQHLRREASMTQEALAEALAITAQAVSKWENDLSCPDIMTLPALSRLLGVSIDTLLTGETPAAPSSPQVVKRPEELVIRILMVDEDGARIGINLPYPVFRLSTRFGLLSIAWSDDGSEEGAAKRQQMMQKLDFDHIVRLVDSGVTGKLVDLEDGERVLIWTE